MSALDSATADEGAPASGPAAEDLPRECERESPLQSYLSRERERQSTGREAFPPGSPPPQRLGMSYAGHSAASAAKQSGPRGATYVMCCGLEFISLLSHVNCLVCSCIASSRSRDRAREGLRFFNRNSSPMISNRNSSPTEAECQCQHDGKCGQRWLDDENVLVRTQQVPGRNGLKQTKTTNVCCACACMRVRIIITNSDTKIRKRNHA